MKQYTEIKKKYPDTILLFRVGDFYETFFEDAVIASKTLNITLTSRDHGFKERVPLAGVPYHSVESYIARLVRAGYRVAICEQMEDAKKAKGIVKREVVEVLSPGTVLSERLLKEKENNYLLALYHSKTSEGIKGTKSVWGLSTVDLTTGEFAVTEIKDEHLADEIRRISPAELLLPSSWQDHITESGKISKTSHETTRPRDYLNHLKTILGEFPKLAITYRDDWFFNYNQARQALLEHFKTASLDGFGCEDIEVGISSAGAALAYITEMQKTTLTHINRLQRYTTEDYILLDYTTLQNLELLHSIREGGKEGSLLAVMDKTETSMGARLLRRNIRQPLLNVDKIKARLSAVEELVNNFNLRKEVKRLLSSVGDMERLAGRIGCGRCNARDLIGLKESLKILPKIKNAIANVSSPLLVNIRDSIESLDDIVNIIEKSIIDEPPLSLREGGLIKDGFNSNLDELRKISTSGKDWILKLQEKERERTGISSLKVGYNKVFGYFIEVTKPNLKLVPSNYIRKQTIATGERFITQELKDYEDKVLSAEEKITELEYDIFCQIRTEVSTQINRIQKSARAIAELDFYSTLATVAVENDYTKPDVNDSDVIHIVDGRHPVVERLLVGESFVPNDTLLDTKENQILIITGPNMAGKSVYIRQVGLIVLLAQIGSFVPAKKAEIGIVDRIFTRVGASDNLARGQSTFLVEMNETANILNNATNKSLILLDEIGRGTSTFDGLSIAWAVTEYLHNNPSVSARTLFATHYHELTDIAKVLQRVKNYNSAVKEWGDNVVFLRKIVEGGADRSYGIQVARLAGLPKTVIERAKEILANLESSELTPEKTRKKLQNISENSSLAKGERKFDSQLSLFAPTIIYQDHPVIEELKKLDLTRLTPLEALNKLNELKEKLDS